jgi:hypothetical protein
MECGSSASDRLTPRSRPTPTQLAELSRLRAALPGYEVSITSHSPSCRFEAIRRPPRNWTLVRHQLRRRRPVARTRVRRKASERSGHIGPRTSEKLPVHTYVRRQRAEFAWWLRTPAFRLARLHLIAPLAVASLRLLGAGHSEEQRRSQVVASRGIRPGRGVSDRDCSARRAQASRGHLLVVVVGAISGVGQRRSHSGWRLRHAVPASQVCA